jgi:sec-independent protein translocase protein TatC
MKDTDFITFKLLCEWFGVCIKEIPVSFQSTTMSGQFSYALMMSIMGGIVLSFPFIFYQIWSFVKPGLKQNEKSVAKGIVFYVSVLFFIGILFGYFVVAPLAVQFFGSYQISKSINNIFSINDYLGTVLSTIFYTGLLFLLPVVAYLFTRLGVITPAFLIKFRKHAIVGVLVISAAITPPEVISQIIVAIPIVLLYEASILVSKRVEDITAAYQKVDLPYRYYPLLIKWLSYELSLTRQGIGEEIKTRLKMDLAELLNDTFEEDRERTDMILVPGGVSGR